MHHHTVCVKKKRSSLFFVSPAVIRHVCAWSGSLQGHMLFVQGSLFCVKVAPSVETMQALLGFVVDQRGTSNASTNSPKQTPSRHRSEVTQYLAPVCQLSITIAVGHEDIDMGFCTGFCPG